MNTHVHSTAPVKKVSIILFAVNTISGVVKRGVGINQKVEREPCIFFSVNFCDMMFLSNRYQEVGMRKLYPDHLSVKEFF